MTIGSYQSECYCLALWLILTRLSYLIQPSNTLSSYGVLALLAGILLLVGSNQDHDCSTR